MDVEALRRVLRSRRSKRCIPGRQLELILCQYLVEENGEVKLHLFFEYVELPVLQELDSQRSE
jgi:hypothetical protein